MCVRSARASKVDRGAGKRRAGGGTAPGRAVSFSGVGESAGAVGAGAEEGTNGDDGVADQGSLQRRASRWNEKEEEAERATIKDKVPPSWRGLMQALSEESRAAAEPMALERVHAIIW